jgi:carboxypeptidase family protein
VTTHLRARALQAGALLVLVGGMLAVASAPAQADGEPTVNITSLSATANIPSGSAFTVTYQITNPLKATDIRFGLEVTGVSCPGQGCSPKVTVPAGTTSPPITAQVTAPKVDPGQTKTVTITVTATADGSGKSGKDSQDVTVRGADKPQTVRQISGRVKDQGGQPLAGASVGIADGANHRYDTVTNDDGRYSFNSSDDKPILAGPISVAAVKNGYKTVTQRVNGDAGKTVNVGLVMVSTTASASPSPSASPTPSPTPADEATDGAAGDEPTDAATDATDLNNAANKDDGGSSLLFIIIGGLLVAAGVGAIVLVIMRRRSAGDDPDDLDGGGGPPGVVPPSGGRYQGLPDATRIAAPMGARGNDATMITNRAGAASLADQPTMLQQAVPADDEFPDPYGAPSAQPHGGYAGPGGYGTTAAPAAAPATGGYGAAANPYSAAPEYGAAQAPAPAYGDDGYGTSPYSRPAAPADDPYAAYGAPNNGYGGDQAQRFDEPTGMYRPEEIGGYDQRGYQPEPEYPPAPPNGRQGRPDSTGAYQPGGYQPAADYGQEPDQGGYGGWNAPADGIDNGSNAYGPPPANGGYGAAGNAYEAPARGGAAYGAPATGGSPYGAPADNGYGDEGGYDQRPAYGRGQPPTGGYGAAQPPAGGYGAAQPPAGGYGAAQPPAGGYGAAQPPAGGYGAAQPPAGGYGGQPQGGYGGQPDGYGTQGGYDDQAGYGGAPGQTGQADQDGYYGADQGGGRHGGRSRQQPPPDSAHPGQRRPLDWLDD